MTCSRCISEISTSALRVGAGRCEKQHANIPAYRIGALSVQASFVQMVENNRTAVSEGSAAASIARWLWRQPQQFRRIDTEAIGQLLDDFQARE